MEISLATEVNIQLYRIVQEALNNALKHARAKKILIHLEVSGPNFLVSVQDDGVGIAPSVSGLGGMGLHIMRYRARTIGATLEILSNISGGTTVVCSLTQKK